jgi:CHAT domain-containing protein
VRGDRGPVYRFLPGRDQEVERIVQLAGGRQAVVRRGTEASTAQLIADLPLARWAHLATHGSFADFKGRRVLRTSVTST